MKRLITILIITVVFLAGCEYYEVDVFNSPVEQPAKEVKLPDWLCAIPGADCD